MRAISLVCVVCVLGMAAMGNAATITVNAGGGADWTTIAAAVSAATAGDTIDILSDITESGILVNKSLTFVGQGADVTTVTGEATGGIFRLSGSANNFVFTDLKLTGGNTTAFGGAIGTGGNWVLKTGSVKINRMAFVDNFASAKGGAVGFGDWTYAPDNNGYVEITNSTFENNSVNPTSSGGGGAVHIGSIHTAIIRNSTFSGNNLTNAAPVWSAFGGAVYMNVIGDTSPVGLIQNSTFVDNSITGNTGTGGAAIYGSFNVDVESSVFAGNTTVGGNIVTLVFGGGWGPDGTITNSLSEGNILSDTTDGGGNTQNVGDALVDVLADNGGPTLTHALLAGSLAIDAGSDPAGLTYDQRGVGYDRTWGAGTDMGAFEVSRHPGDAVGLDGKVDVFDLVALANHYGRPGSWEWADGDFNGSIDGLREVDVFDLVILANNYGWGTGGGGAAVPEPMTMGLLAVGAVAMIRRRRRG